MKYRITLQKVFNQDVEVEADSKEEALEAYWDGKATNVGELRYGHTYDDMDENDVEEVESE